MEEVEPPGRAVPRGAEPGLPPPPARCVGLGGDTKAPACSPAPGGGVRPGARRAAGQVGRFPPGRGRELGLQTPTPRSLRSPGSRAARLAELVAGAPGPPGNAASVAASVGSARARRRERSVSFDLFLCSASPGLGAASGAPRGCQRPQVCLAGSGKRERGAAAWCIEGYLLACGWRWRGRRGFGEGSEGHGGGGPGTREVVPGVASVWSAGGVGLSTGVGEGLGRGMALSAAPPSPRMPPGAPVRRSCLLPAPRASQLRPHPAHPRVGPLASPLLSGFPTRRSCPRAPPAAPRPLRGGGGAVMGQMLGVFCADDPCAWGACSWKGSDRTKQAGLVGLCLRSGAPRSRLGWGWVGGGGAWHGFGKSREIGKTVTGT